MPLDLQRTLVNQIWTLLEQRAGFTSRVGEGGRIRTTDQNWRQLDDKLSAADGLDFFPHTRVLAIGDSMPGEVTLLSLTGVDYPIPQRWEIEVRTIFFLDDDAAAMPLENEIRLALLIQGGPYLGLDTLVKRRTWRATRRGETTRETGGKRRTVCRLNLTVDTEVYPSELL